MQITLDFVKVEQALPKIPDYAESVVVLAVTDMGDIEKTVFDADGFHTKDEVVAWSYNEMPSWLWEIRDKAFRRLIHEIGWDEDGY